jgi:hypothetical protein
MTVPVQPAYGGVWISLADAYRVDVSKGALESLRH